MTGYRKQVVTDTVTASKCTRCSAPVVKARAGRVAALDVVADPEPVTDEVEDHVRKLGALTWCMAESPWGADRVQFRCTIRSCTHPVLRDHICSEEEGRMTDALFSTPESAPKQQEVKRNRWGQYVLPHPETGKERSWQRVTTFCKMTADTFSIGQWQQRMLAKGMAQRPDLVAMASTLDPRSDYKKLNDLAEQAKKAAGSTSAATLGTAMHSMTEALDTDPEASFSGEYARRMEQYRDAIKAHGLTPVKEYVERITCWPQMEVAGTMDRLYRTRDGDLVVGDLKTGRSLDYGMNEIAVQLACYAEGVMEAGLFDPDSQSWEPTGEHVRDDYAIVVHLPAQGDGCTLHRVDLDAGREGAHLSRSVRDWRKRKGLSEVMEAPPAPEPSPTDWDSLVAAATSRKDLEAIATKARGEGAWGKELHGKVMDRLASL